MNRIATTVLIATVASLAACAGRVTTDMSDAHAILEPQQYQGGDATWPVRIVEIDGVNQDGTRVFYPLAPGTHEVIVEVADGVREDTLLTSAQRSVIPIRRGLTIEMVGGKRYVVAAHPTGKVAEEWLPVLVKIEEVSP